jgi:glutamate formiminotransferase / 5-formyltetrahydrofolate cyclo-ligase
MPPRTLLAVPNVSEGRDAATIAAIGAAIVAHRSAPGSAGGAAPGETRPAGAPDAGVRLLDVHSDPDHDRSVFSYAGAPGAVAAATIRAAEVALARIDLSRAGRDGQHPHVGVLDVAPVVYPVPEARGAACAEALVLGERLGAELGMPVFLYGELTAGPDGCARSRAELRRDGLAGLAARVAAGASSAEEGLRPDFGPLAIDPRRGATLVAARPPLVAFNIELAPPATITDARRIASLIREGGEQGLPGLRAIGIELGGGRPQVSMNVERPFELPLAEVAAAIAGHAALARAEIVGLAPAVALEGFPEDLPLPGFDPALQVIENALGC